MAVPNTVAALAVAATLTVTGGTLAGAEPSEYMTPVDVAGVQLTGRARNESCSITTNLRSVDGKAHTVSVNQHPKYGPADLTVPAGGQVTVVVNGDYHGPYLVTVDGTTVERPVPDVTPGGHPCTVTPATTVVTRITPAPTAVPESTSTSPSAPERGGPVPPTVTPPSVEAPPATTTTPPAIELVTATTAVPELPVTGAVTRTLAVIGFVLLFGGSAILAGTALGAWLRRRNR
jgi:hypothetical protein